MIFRKTAVSLGLLGAVLLGSFSGCATPIGIGDQLGLSPHWDWKTLETDHFRFTFPEELADTARKAAEHFEEGHRLLSARLKWEPKNKTQILVVDHEDSANGLTTPIGRFGIVLMATPPENWFSTYFYDDWLRLLVIHEYTHFLNMDPTSGFWVPLRAVFGDVLLPNSIWPTWMLEGLAVYMETSLTRSGRGRSPYYNMILRAAVEEDALDRGDFVTLDRVNGETPYYPSGETAYLFGYYLMNRVVSSSEGGEDALGELSIRSSRRVPFLINDNLEEITGKDWYQVWDDWVAETRVRARSELDRIRSHPLTPFIKLTQGGRYTLGSAFSPDGRWLAFTQDSSDHRMKLFVKDRKSGETFSTDKLYGASMAFLPDNKTLLLSSLHRDTRYTLHSDLAAFDVESRTWHWLTDGLRARDPDVSRDGKWVVFTRSQNSTTGLAIASLELTNSGYQLGEIRSLYDPAKYDAAYTPKFSADGKEIYFSLHRNGQPSEELMSIEISSGKITERVSNGRFNRFPVVHPSGEIYFLSDLSGVDNVYRYSPLSTPRSAPTAITNVTTGLLFPSISPEGKLHASYFSYTGWDLAEAQEGLGTLRDQISAPLLEPQPAPSLPSLETRAPAQMNAATEEYSVFPSILPRQWSPVALVRPSSVLLGAEALGFDAIDRHRYSVAAAYDTLVRRPDLSVAYFNRSLGPTLSAQYTVETTGIGLDPLAGHLQSFVRKTKYSLSASLPFRWTYSGMNTALALNAERSFLFAPGASPETEDLVSKSRYIPSVDAAVSFSNTESSPLAITPEGGRSTVVATRLYLDQPDPVWKALIKDTEYLPLTQHSVLVPAAKASWVSRENSYSASRVNVQGRSLGSIFSSLPSDSLDEIAIRGYPNRTFFARAAAAGSLDYRFPIARIFRGWGTNPAFLENLYGFGFAEVAWVPQKEAGAATLPSVGAGLKLSATAFIHVPLVFSLEFHRGFQESAGGTGELFFHAGFGSFKF